MDDIIENRISWGSERPVFVSFSEVITVSLLWHPDVVKNVIVCLRTWFCQTAGSCFLLSSVTIISHHVLSAFFCLSQAHGSGRPEELHLLAESEPRRHRVCRAGLRYVQSASQTAVMGRRQTPPSVDSAPALLTRETEKPWMTLWPGPLLRFTCTTQRKCWGKPFYMHQSNSV